MSFGVWAAKSARYKKNRASNPFLVPDTASENRWEDSANCKGKAFELFEYQEKDSPLVVGLSFKERIAMNAANFQLAEEICIECSSFFECGESASPDEKYWTVRGGQPPGRFEEESKKHVKINSADRKCQRGHMVRGGGRCMQCKKAGQAARRAKARAEGGTVGQDGVTS